jgi:outer membrane lipoprotein-sorting protein
MPRANSAEPFAPMKDVAAFTKLLDLRAAETSTIESSFLQEKHLEMFSAPVKSTGCFCFKKPGKVRWEYLSPFAYRIIMDGNDVYITSDGKTERHKASENKVFSEINKRIMETVRGDIIRNNSDFSYEYFENGKQFLVALTPYRKAVKEFVSSIKVYFDRDTATISRLEVFEPSKDYMTIDFYDKKIDQGIDDGKFKN